MKRLAGIDGVRAMACIMVMAHHAAQKLNVEILSRQQQELIIFLRQCSAGVSIFFVLSGFLLSYPFWENYLTLQSMPSLKNYILRRAARIIPGFYLALVLSWIASIVLIPQMVEPFKRLIGGLTFTSGFHYLTFYPTELNPPLWSISFEVFCYFLLPIFMTILFQMPCEQNLKNGLRAWLSLLVLNLGFNALFVHIFKTDAVGKGWEYGFIGGAKYLMPNYNPWGFFGHYILGVIAAGVSVDIAHRNNSQELKKNYRWIAADFLSIVATAILFGILWILRQAPEFSYSISNQPYFYPLFATWVAVLLIALPQSKILSKLYDNFLFIIVSRLSFGLYLWHSFLMETVRLFKPDYTYNGMNDVSQWALMTGVIFIISTIIASLSWQYLELPMVKIARKFAGTK
jgi:peptidoglycan/LPS O-acetylase OafA/YrhL